MSRDQPLQGFASRCALCSVHLGSSGASVAKRVKLYRIIESLHRCSCLVLNILGKSDLQASWTAALSLGEFPTCSAQLSSECEHKSSQLHSVSPQNVFGVTGLATRSLHMHKPSLAACTRLIVQGSTSCYHAILKFESLPFCFGLARATQRSLHIQTCESELSDRMHSAALRFAKHHAKFYIAQQQKHGPGSAHRSATPAQPQTHGPGYAQRSAAPLQPQTYGPGSAEHSAPPGQPQKHGPGSANHDATPEKPKTITKPSRDQSTIDSASSRVSQNSGHAKLKPACTCACKVKSERSAQLPTALHTASSSVSDRKTQQQQSHEAQQQPQQQPLDKRSQPLPAPASKLVEPSQHGSLITQPAFHSSCKQLSGFARDSNFVLELIRFLSCSCDHRATSTSKPAFNDNFVRTLLNDIADNIVGTNSQAASLSVILLAVLSDRRILLIADAVNLNFVSCRLLLRVSAFDPLCPAIPLHVSTLSLAFFVNQHIRSSFSCQPGEPLHANALTACTKNNVSICLAPRINISFLHFGILDQTNTQVYCSTAVNLVDVSAKCFSPSVLVRYPSTSGPDISSDINNRNKHRILASSTA